MRRPFHPLVFALYPVLSLYSLNTALIPPSDVPIPLVVILAITCALWGVLSLLLRSALRGAAGASVGIVCFFSFGHIWNFVHNVDAHRFFVSNRSELLVYWAPLAVAIFVLGCWKWKKSEQIAQAMNFVSIVLVGVPTLSIAAAWFVAWKGKAIHSVHSNVSKLNTSVRPDIYYVVLDGYGRSDALKDVIGFSNKWFVDELQRRNFFVAKNSKANYCETELSLASSLNLDYLPKILPDYSPNWDDRGILDKLIDESTVSKYLRTIGYQYVAYTTGFPAVHPYSADIWLQDTQGASLLTGALMSDTPLPEDSSLPYTSLFGGRRMMIRAAAANMARAAEGGTKPKFVLVHILAPHPPFVFGPNGEPTRVNKMTFSLVDGSHYYDNGGTPAEYAKGYADQATYISKLMLEAVDQITKKSHVPPIIILQGDHGSKMKLNQELLDKTDVNECFPNLNAYLVPPSVRTKLYDGITPVNSFRMIFNGLFEDAFPKLPDRSYYSGWSSPFKFIEVTDKLKTAKP